MNVKYFHFIFVPTYQLLSIAASQMDFKLFFIPVWTLLQRTEDVYLLGLYSNFFIVVKPWVYFCTVVGKIPILSWCKL